LGIDTTHVRYSVTNLLTGARPEVQALCWDPSAHLHILPAHATLTDVERDFVRRGDGRLHLQPALHPGVMKKRTIPLPGIDPVLVPLAWEVPRPFSSSLVQRVQGFFCTKRAPVWWKRLPELFVSPLLWWWRPSQQHSRSGQSTHSWPGPVPSV